jgi:division/cell wall cluster transcriptional repressor MraZ
MVTRKSHVGWMALGGLLCLLGVVLACKMRDGNRAMAQSDPAAPAVGTKTEPAKVEDPPRMLPPLSSEVPPPPAADVAPPPAPAPAPAAVLPNEATPTKAPTTILIPASATVPAAPPEPPSTGTGGSQPLPPIPEVKAEGKAAPPPPASPSSAPLPASTALPPPAADHPSEPPLAPAPGPVLQYKVPGAGETFKSLARKTLGSSERWGDIHKLNPIFRADATIPAGTMLRLPGDACVQDEGESVRPLPTLRARLTPRVKSALPLTGTFPVTVDEGKGMTLPRVILEQLGHCDTVLLSPGSDKCLWLTNQAHLDRLQAKLDKSPARESDIRGFKRLYYAQTVKAPVKDGRIVIADKLAAFAGLGAEVVLVGIDDHFEVWDAARWRKYTREKKAAGFDE